MRIRHILSFEGFRPSFCRGADPVSAFVSGVLGVGSSGISAATSAANVDKQLDAQREENQKNRDWQTEQAEIARQFTTNERLAQQEYQTGAQRTAQSYALQSMAQQAVYNSPVYQRQELKKAGINPQVYFGQQSSFSGSSPQVGSAPAAPSGASSPMPSGVSGLSPVSYQPWQLNIGQLLQNLATAAKLSKETGWLDKDMTARLRSLNAQSSLQEMQVVISALDKRFKELQLPFVQDKAYLEVKKAFSEIELNDESKITQRSQQKLNSALENLQDSLSQLTDKQREKLGIEIQFLPQTLKSIINANTAKAAESVAAAGEHTANAEQIRIFNKLYGDQRYQHSFISSVVSQSQKAISDGLVSKRQAEQLKYMVEQAAYSNDMKEFTYWTGQVESFIGTLGQAASQFYGVGDTF